MDLCNCTDITYSFNLLSTSLVMYLDALKFCNCPEFRKECKDRHHAITTFHKMVYDKFCEFEKFESICASNLNQENKDIFKQCNQIIQYERGVPYDEWIIGWSPFCPTYGAGASQRAYNTSPSTFSPYNNMPSRCRIGTLTAMAIFYLLAVAIIVANVTVLLVVRLDQYFHTPYGYFKASIAVADLLVGVLVIPELITQFHIETFYPLPFREPGEYPEFHRRNTPAFFFSIGFFTILTLSVSVYSLAASSFDRYFSISRPFKYEAKHFLTKKRSLTLIVAIWILSTIYGLFPLMKSSTAYGMVSATFVLAAERVEQNRHPPFPYNALFNSTQKFSASQETNGAEFDEKSVQGRTYLSAYAFHSEEVSDIPSTIASTVVPKVKHSSASGNSQGMYLILTMYFFSLVIPLVLVWVVNVCTIRSFRKKNSKTKEPSKLRSVPRCTIDSPDHNHSSSSCASPYTSVTSLQSAVADDVRNKNIIKLENHVQKKFENSSNNNQFLTVPTALKYGRNSLPNVHSTTPIARHVPPRPRSTTSSFRSERREAVRRDKRKESPVHVASRMQKILLRMVIAFTICLLPAICSLIMHLLFAPFTDLYNARRYSSNVKLFQNIFAYISSVFLFGNSFVNCIIYTVLGKRFRDVSRKLYAGKVSQIQNTFRRMSVAIDQLKNTSVDPTKTKPQIIEHRV